MNQAKTYSELSRLAAFEDRFEYLKIGGDVGGETFGSRRFSNQSFYHSPEWKKVRSEIIARDQGCDLGIFARPIIARIEIHHMNPITFDQILNGDDTILDPEYLITVSPLTHKAIHYGSFELLAPDYKEREIGDTKLW